MGFAKCSAPLTSIQPPTTHIFLPSSTSISHSKYLLNLRFKSCPFKIFLIAYLYDQKYHAIECGTHCPPKHKRRDEQTKNSLKDGLTYKMRVYHAYSYICQA